MRFARVASLPPFLMGKKRWHVGSAYILIAFILSSQVAPLMSPDYIWDDLVWYWSYRVDGTQALFHFLSQVGHPLFWPFLDFPYRAFGEHATLPTTLVSLTFHLANAILIGRLMCFSGAGRVSAFIAFVLYWLSPYYFNRGTVSHYFYDVFMFLWLLSVYLGAPRKTGRIKRFIIAPFCQILSIGLPTLIMLEPLRLVMYGSLCRNNYRELAKAVMPYWILGAICAVTAYILFKPTGYYQGYNQLYFDVWSILSGFLEYLLFLPRALYFHADNVFLVLHQPFDWPLVVLSVLVVFVFFRMMPLPEKRTPNLDIKFLLFICALSFFLGAVPYVLAARFPAVGEFNSRLFYVSGFAVVVVAAILLGRIPSARARVLSASGLAALFIVSGFQQGKAYMYDYLIRQSVLSQLQENMPQLGNDIIRQEMFIGLIAEPPFWDLSVQRRLYGPMEFSVPLNIDEHSMHGRWFVQYLDLRTFSPPDYILPPHECTFAAHDRHPCPANYLLMKYKVNVQDSGITDFSFVRMFYESFLAEKPVQIGRLTLLTKPRPMNINAMAARWFRKLAEEGDPEAQNKLGLMYLNGFADIPQDDAKAFKWFHQSSAKGDLDARLNVGLMYMEGRGVKKDDNEAARLIYSAAREGNAIAQYNYGLLYERGFGVIKNDKDAFAWYLKAADQGHALAQARVGVMLANGIGVSSDIMAAIRWLRKAGDQNEKNAQYILAMIFLDGRGVSKDAQAAIELFHRAAEQDYAPAQFILGKLYEQGHDVPRDNKEAYFWYQLASRHVQDSGYGNAKQATQSVASLLSEQDKMMLNERVSNWRPQPKQSPAWNN